MEASYVVIAAIVILVSVGTTARLVQYSSRRSMGIEMTFSKAVKAVVLRAGVILGSGLGLGYLIGRFVDAGWVQKELVLQPSAALLVAASCGLVSLLGYTWIMRWLTGSFVSILSVVRSILLELGLYVAIVVVLGTLLGAVAWWIGGFV